MTNFYDLSFNDSRGNSINMNQFRGQVVLIVNTATKCGLVGQFAELESLHQEFKTTGLVVIGFPCDQFMNQEPETNESMAQVCQVNFGVTFLLSEKVNVNGRRAHPVFVYLKSQSPKSLLGNKIKWSFTKFLISKDGKSVKRYAPTVSPASMRSDIVHLMQ